MGQFLQSISLTEMFWLDQEFLDGEAPPAAILSFGKIQ